MSRLITKEDKANIRKVFRCLDPERKQKIPIEKTDEVLRKMGYKPNQDDVKYILKIVDINGTGYLTLQQFYTFFNIFKIHDRSRYYDDIIDAFRVFDQGHTGFVSANELYYVLTHLGDKLSDGQIEALMDKAEINSNNMINYEQFVHAVLEY